MRKFKKWLISEFLPAWAKDSLCRENERLKLEIAQLRASIAERDAYIDGLEHGIRAQRRIVINATGGAAK